MGAPSPFHMLKSLTIQNFRGFAEHKIEFGRESILIGKNNAGKSTVTEALKILSVCQARIPTAQYIAVPAWLDGLCAGAGFTFSLETIDFDFANVQHAYRSDRPAIIKAKNSNHTELHIYIGRGQSEVFCQLRLNQRGPVHSRQMANRDFGKVKVMPPVGSLLPHEKPITKERLRKYLNGYLAHRHFRNQLWERPSEYRLFKKLLEETWSGLAIQHFENDHGEGQNEFSLLIREGPFTSEASWHGHGLQAWLQTVWFLARTDRQSTIVLDEPDVYLHADLQRKLLKLIQGLDFKQSIIATHSSEIIGDVPFNHVTVVQKRERVSKPAEMADEIQAALTGMGSLHSIELAKVAQSGLILFVEGDDKPFLTDIAYKLGPSTFDRVSSIAIQELKGKDNWKYALGASRALREASAGQISVALIIDRDYMLDEEIVDCQAIANKEGMILKIWRKKEIENYFICEKAIQRFLISRVEQNIPIDDVKALISRVENDLREDILLSFTDRLQQVCKPRIEPKTAFQRAKALIAKRIDAGEKLRDLASGKTFISSLSKICQDQYGVSFGALSLCKAMRADEIPGEFKELIVGLEQPKLLKSDTFTWKPTPDIVA